MMANGKINSSDTIQGGLLLKLPNSIFFAKNGIISYFIVILFLQASSATWVLMVSSRRSMLTLPFRDESKGPYLGSHFANQELKGIEE